MIRDTSRDRADDLADPLAQCRADIDRIDAVLVALLRERTRLAVNAGRIKAATGLALEAPAREAAVLERVRQLTTAPLVPEAVARIFASIIDETRAVQALSPDWRHDRTA